MRLRIVPCFILSLLTLAPVLFPGKAEMKNLPATNLHFFISFPETSSRELIDGRILLLVSTDESKEPRFQINEDLNTQQVFGVDVGGLKPGQEAVVNASTFGYPVRSLSDLKPGEYWVQALLHRYETFKRADGHAVKLPMDRGEGQQWNSAPGNLYSAPLKVTVRANDDRNIKILLDKVIPPIEPPKDTKYIKHVTDYSERFHLAGYNKIQEEYAYKFYKDWTGPNFPRMIIIEIQHANPYYDDSYAVNSANLGPYGDAITYELVPFIEKQFRGIGKGWARFMYGGSTGGWEALAVQIFYPDEYNGAWGACPDPIDFRAYTVVNLYEHENAYRAEATWKQTPRPGKRNYLGELAATLEEMNYMELALGTNSRSGGQFDIWQAVYSPVGKDGYPKPIWDKATGKIDRSVAEYWREHYDLGHILRRDWKKLGPKLEGKLHIYVGEADNYYLNNAVYLVEEFLKSTKNPYYGGEVDYGPRAEHCWNGDHSLPNAIARLRYHQFYAPKIVERILKSAPKGADLTSWRY